MCGWVLICEDGWFLFLALQEQFGADTIASKWNELHVSNGTVAKRLTRKAPSSRAGTCFPHTYYIIYIISFITFFLFFFFLLLLLRLHIKDSASPFRSSEV
jgi:hypothetical protein